MKQKGFTKITVIIIIIVVIVAGFLGYMVLFKKPVTPALTGQPQEVRPATGNDSSQTFQLAETVNWGMYLNDEFGFEFKYPEKYSSYPSDSKDVLLLKSDKDAQTWDIRISWYVWSSGVKNINELTNLKNSVSLKIGAEDALKLSNGEESKQVGYVFIHNGKEYDFEINTTSLEIMGDVEQIISTFRFTK